MLQLSPSCHGDARCLRRLPLFFPSSFPNCFFPLLFPTVFSLFFSQLFFPSSFPNCFFPFLFPTLFQVLPADIREKRDATAHAQGLSPRHLTICKGDYPSR
jgi:hypothetical protein